MEVIVVSGKAKGIGKTTLTSMVIENLKYGVGAIKTTIKDNLGSPLVTTEQEVIESPGSDTALLAESGAEMVVFLESSRDKLKESLDQARELVKGLDYLVVEGNSILDYLKPALTIYLTGDDFSPKDSAKKARARSDVIIDYREMTPVVNGEKDLRGIDFDFNLEAISCYQAHLLSKALGIKLPVVGKKIDQSGIKVRHCQLGLF